MLDARTREWLSGPTFSADQAAQMLGMSRPSVIRAVERGEINGTRIGRRIIIPTAQLRRILMVDDLGSAPANAA